MLMELLKRFIFNKVIFPDDDLAALLEPKVEVAGPEDAVELVGYVEVLRPPYRQFLHEMSRDVSSLNVAFRDDEYWNWNTVSPHKS